MTRRPDYDAAVQAHLWEVHGYLAYRLSSRADAEDLTQATFERAFKAWARYDPKRASVRTWLLTIAHNLLVDHFRQRASRPEAPLHEGADSTAVEERFSLGLDPALAGALEGLGERERELVALRFGGDLTGPEIAALTSLTLANVQQILSRALRKLRAALEVDSTSG
jgi:RNA polymerase sigma-70 factor (ECF subfamily)